MLGNRRSDVISAKLWTSVLLPCCILIAGCGGNSGSPGTDQPDSDDHGGAPLFSDEVVQTLRRARDDCRAKLESMDFDQARAELLLELGDEYPDITSATLAADGTTIFMEMEDGTLAALDTTDFSELWQGIDSEIITQARTMPAFPTGHAEVALESQTATRHARAMAADFLTPSSRKALLITAAGITDPIAVDTVEEARDALADHGWTSNDIDLLARTEAGTDLTPEDFFNLGSYGLIIMVGHGGWNYFDGVPLHFLQCCSNVDYSPIVGDDRQAKYEQWKAEGKMILFMYADPILEADAEDIYLRSDLLEEQVGTLPASHVHILSCFSLAAHHAFTNNNAGDFWGWNHKGPALQGKDLIVAVLEGLLEEEPKTNVQVATALDAARTYLIGSIESRLTLRYWTASNFYLPGWVGLTVDTAAAPSGTHEIWIELAYTEPGLAGVGARELLVGSSHQFDDIVPAEARFKIIAVDSGGNTLASGQETVQLHAGLNELDLAFCTAQADFSVSEYPRAGVTVQSVAVEAVHSDPTVDPIPPFTLNPADTKTIEDFLVGELSVTSQAWDSGGTLVGISEQTFGLDCDENDLELCFGWVKVYSNELPLHTATVTVETSFADALLEVPNPVEYTPGSSAVIVGFRVGSEVTFTATAQNAAGQELRVETVNHVMTCGENELAIDFFDYDIILSASPTKVQANGFDTSLITATLKKMTEDDVLVPTGDPVAGKSVVFETNLGTFITGNPVVTGADGVATVELVSAVEGTATVRALVQEDLVESNTVEVQFGEDDEPAPPASDVLEVELFPKQANLCMNDELTISASVSVPTDSTVEYSWSAPMWADKGGIAQFRPLYDSAGNAIGALYDEPIVYFDASIWNEYEGHVYLSVKQYDADGHYLASASDACEIRVEVCGNEIPVTIEAVTTESGGSYCAYPRTVFVWTKESDATGYLLGIHPNKEEYIYGDIHYSNRGLVINTVGNILDVGSEQAGYVITSSQCSEWQDEPPDLSALNETLEYYEEVYGSYTATVQPLYD
ncbi:MAG TPA: invasin domain 3-containing protein [Phycisphaerae bacterium]|nr:invasin domain 3-containing protein [Phycisphaerae bacterium]